jgi:hypothetical protein
MNETELIETGARRRGAFDLGGNQKASRNYPRALAQIDMNEMLRENEEKKREERIEWQEEN